MSQDRIPCSQMSACAARNFESQEDREANAAALRTSSLATLPEGRTPEDSATAPLQILDKKIDGLMIDREADLSCAHLGPDGILEALNLILTPQLTADVPGLRQVLERFCRRKYDLGYAYGYLRHLWNADNFATFDEDERRARNEDKRMRRWAIKGDKIVRPDTPPRRIWDLYSNRVLPWWMVKPDMQSIYAVSHSWVAEGAQQSIKSPINREEWRVPLPKVATPEEDNSTLERVRNELLNLGAEYAWLDVLCMRQEDNLAAGQSKLDEERALDVPTIGYVYYKREHILMYLSGLGCPLQGIPTNDERSWLKRAWTLQETNPNPHIGGLPWSFFDTENVEASDIRSTMEDVKASDMGYKNIFDEIAAVAHSMKDGYDAFTMINHIRGRCATSEVDKIAGLAYLLRSNQVPVYHKDEDLESAWVRLVECMNEQYRSDLAYLWPSPGLGLQRWIPSWGQLMDLKTPLPRPELARFLTEDSAIIMSRPLEPHKFYHVGKTIRTVEIKGLNEEEPFSDAQDQTKCRVGKLNTQPRGKGDAITVAVEAHRTSGIKDGRYTLLGPYLRGEWAVCEWCPLQGKMPYRLTKVGSIVVLTEDDRRRLRGEGDKKTGCYDEAPIVRLA